MWYVVLIPISILYTIAAREVAGPGYTTAPNQYAMLVFGLAACAWPLFALVLAMIIRRLAQIRGAFAMSLGVLSWATCAVVPFMMGMK